MTAGAVLDAVNLRWPHAHGADEVEPLILQAENLARVEVLGQPVLDALPDEELSIVAPYDAAYVHFAAAMIAQMDGAYERYNAEMALYTALYDSFAKGYRRANLPERGAEVHTYG